MPSFEEVNVNKSFYIDELHLENNSNRIVVSSRVIAEKFNKRHDNVIQSIENITTENSGLIYNYFIPSTYRSGTGKGYAEYLLTKDGFSLLVMGFTGSEALHWKIKYIEAFNKMEIELTKQQKPMSMEDIIIYQMQQIKAVKEQVNKAQETASKATEDIQSMRNIMLMNSDTWREDSRKIIVSIAQKIGGNEYIHDVWKECYSLLEQRGKVKLVIRLNNRRRNILAETGSNEKSRKYTKLDVIDEEPKLRETFIAIVKEMAIKYGIA